MWAEGSAVLGFEMGMCCFVGERPCKCLMRILVLENFLYSSYHHVSALHCNDWVCPLQVPHGSTAWGGETYVQSSSLNHKCSKGLSGWHTVSCNIYEQKYIPYLYFLGVPCIFVSYTFKSIVMVAGAVDGGWMISAAQLLYIGWCLMHNNLHSHPTYMQPDALCSVYGEARQAHYQCKQSRSCIRASVCVT